MCKACSRNSHATSRALRLRSRFGKYYGSHLLLLLWRGVGCMEPGGHNCAPWLARLLSSICLPFFPCSGAADLLRSHPFVHSQVVGVEHLFKALCLSYLGSAFRCPAPAPGLRAHPVWARVRSTGRTQGANSLSAAHALRSPCPYGTTPCSQPNLPSCTLCETLSNHLS